MKRQVSDALWVVVGSSTTALGTLVGVRILTQFMKPSAYGVLTLVLGLSTLVVSMVATPLTQAGMHFFPAVAKSGSPRQIIQSLVRGFRRMLPWILAVSLSVAIACVMRGESVVVVGLVTALIASDCWRSANLSLLNAARRHRTYVLWTFTDTWARPLAGAAVATLIAPTAAAVLLAYVAVSVSLSVGCSRRLWSGSSQQVTSKQASDALDARMWSYALPLIPLGIIAWASNLGDRYIIASTLSLADAGIYAAVYGLSSAPFMLAGGTVELLLRPVHQAAVAKGQHLRAMSVLYGWVATVAGIGIVGVLILYFGHGVVASLSVGKEYRGASGLMPWIGLGYAIRATSYVLERVCYAYGQTSRVLAAQLFAAAATVIATPVGVFMKGLQGAAMAVPIYFSIQLLVGALLARRTLREATTQSTSAGKYVEVVT